MTALLTASDLTRSFRAGRKRMFRPAPRFNAVDGVDIEVARGETLAIVGESGCGKSTLGTLLLGLAEPSAGRVLFDGQPVRGRGGDAWRRMRRRIQVIFQDTNGSLDPRLPIFAQVREPLDIHRIGARAERDARTRAILGAVGLGPHLWQHVPGELSGGQQQRVVIARAAILEPEMIVCDEPVSALDVSIQAQVLRLLRQLQRDMGLTMVFISHDLAVVRHVADRVAVMYLGRIVETGSAERVFQAPQHPYTQALLAAVPVPDPARRTARVLATGEPPSPMNPPPGCRFHPRCPHAVPRCRSEVPALRPIAGRETACHVAGALDAEITRIAAE